MARTYRNLWPQLVSWDNLLTAYRKCRRRKRYRQAATQFDFCWEQNLLQLQRELLDGTWERNRSRAGQDAGSGFAFEAGIDGIAEPPVDGTFLEAAGF